MKYHQPYGVSDPDAGYVNGNPSTGTMGSIPPAASIEYPQREVVNLISDAALVPDDGDLHQLAKGVQSGRLIWGDDTGAVNQVSLAPQPAVAALTKGMQFITMFAHDNTGPAVASVSGLPFIEIIHPQDKTSLQPLDLRAGAIGCLAYDAVANKFQLAWSQAPLGAAVYLTTNLDYYVGGPNASDNNDGTLAALTAGTTHGPFATLQKAMNTIANYNLNGHNINVHVANGTYPGVRIARMSGSGTVFWIGNPASPGSCIIHGTDMSAFAMQNCGNTHNIQGFAVETAGSYATFLDPMCGFNISGTGTGVALYDIQYNQCSGSHLAVTQGAVVGLGKKHMINGNPQGANPGMTQGWHIYLGTNSVIQPDGGNLPVLSIPAPAGGGNGGGFANVYALAFGELFYSSITGAANYSGIKFQVQDNAIINTHGGGINYLPGNIAGVQATGGQYH
jgi:hypothetical protein